MGGKVGDGIGRILISLRVESVAIMPDQPEHVFLSGYGVGGFVTWVSHDGGQDWQRSGDNSFTRQQHRIVAVPSEQPTLLAYGVAGLFESTVEADEWLFHDLGAPLATINHLAVSQVPDGPNLFSNGGAVFQRSGLSNSGWQRGTGLPTMMVTDLYMHPIDPQIALVSSFVPNEWSFFRTIDGGDTWHRLGNVEDSPDKLWHHTTASAVTTDGDREIIYVGTVGCGLMVSDDGGNTWETIAKERCVPPEGTPRNISDLVVFTDNPDSVVAIADHNRIYRTTDQGNTWTFSELEIADELEQIAADAVLQDVVYAINSTDFWRSNDRGQTWESIADDLDGEHIAQFVPVTGQAEVLFAIMRSGTLWKSNDGGYSWRQLRKNSQLRGVTAIVYDPHSSSLLVGTARSGLYRFQQGPWLSLFFRTLKTE